MEALKSIGGALMGVVIFIGVIIAAILFFVVGAHVGAAILPFVSWLTGILFAINIIALLVTISRKTRGVMGLTFLYHHMSMVCRRGSLAC